MGTHTNAILPALAAIVCIACSNGNSGKVIQDAAVDAPRVEDQTNRGEVCTPECGDRACGPDGCGGQCGQCEMIKEVCSDEGQCVPAPCSSTLDCPSNLVCHKESGECVVCVGDEDCPEETTCGADHACHQAYPCDSDKDCKDLEMVCDKIAGLCVQCLGPEECAETKYCLGGYCVADTCVAGESKCKDGSVIACALDGSAWQVSKVCGADQYCLEAACHDNVCPPGESYCDDAIAKTCDELGSAVMAEEDCAADDFNCYNGACTESVCPPNETFCTDDFTAAACAVDGMSFTTASCPAKQYCDSGTCKAQVCDPSSTYCEANMVTICNGKGSAIQSKTDCGTLVCVAGGCYELVCIPTALYCEGKALMECDANGTAASLVQTCGDSQYCSEDGDTAACQDQVCTPATLSCDGTTIVQCDDLGAAWLPGANCADNEQGCLDGECVEEMVCSALSFENASARVVLPKNSLLQLTGHSFTVEAWVSLDHFPYDFMYVVGKMDGTAGAYTGWRLGVRGLKAGDPGTLSFFASGGDSEFVLGGVVPLNQWTHVAVTYNKEPGSATLWIAGEQVAEQIGLQIPETQQSVWFGNCSLPGEDLVLAGQIDEVRISEGILYSESFVPPVAGVPLETTIGLWHFDSGEGFQAFDSSSNELHGDIVGATWSDSSPNCVPGGMCGDGEKSAWEECDDGNSVEGDGCSNGCELK